MKFRQGSPEVWAGHTLRVEGERGGGLMKGDEINGNAAAADAQEKIEAETGPS